MSFIELIAGVLPFSIIPRAFMPTHLVSTARRSCGCMAARDDMPVCDDREADRRRRPVSCGCAGRVRRLRQARAEASPYQRHAGTAAGRR
jgi:hypothetical protein